jgi:hypothetical protein
MSALIDVIALAGALACGWVIASHLSRMVFKRGSWGFDWPALTLPLYGGACIACLAVAGVIGAIPGILIAAVLFGTVTVLLGDSWLKASRLQNGSAVSATRRILAAVGQQARGGAAYIREDVTAAFGLLRPREVQPQPAGPAPVRSTPGVPPWRRTVPGVPSITADPALGAVPAPSEVSAALAASGVIVPPAWAAVAAEAGDHEPETDEEHCEHMDGEVAGILTWAEAAMVRAETLGDVTGLSAGTVSAQYELADAIAELAAFAAQVMRRYHDDYDDLREAADGRPLPANRFWFGDGGAAPQGGRAA